MTPESIQEEQGLENWLDLVVCPRDKEALQLENDFLVCPRHHRYRVVEGVPIFLLSDTPQTHIEGTRALQVAETGDASAMSPANVIAEKTDPFVRDVIGATNGGLYQHLVGKLTDYPIPDLRLPKGEGGLLLEIGSNWGRWCIAAAKLGYRAVGLDPSLKSVLAARRVARQLGVEAIYLVGDGRYLPFRDETFEKVFSYSVLQHLSKSDVRMVLPEIQRVLRPGAECLVQMPNVFGLRCLYHQIRLGFREPRDFDVRYWTIPELKRTFAKCVGPTHVTVDGFFSLNPQISDVRFMPLRFRALLYASEVLRNASLAVPALAYFADSLYVSAGKRFSKSTVG